MRSTIALLAFTAWILATSSSCHSTRPACKDISTVGPENYYRQSINTGAFTISTQVQPTRCQRERVTNQKGILLTVRVYNNAGMSSPLRRVCRTMEAYNAANEYLLNGLRKDIRLECGEARCLPTDFWFENNYNAFPFETFKVGFIPTRSFFNGNSKAAQFVYVDRLFTGDTLRFHYPKSLFQAELKN